MGAGCGLSSRHVGIWQEPTLETRVCRNQTTAHTTRFKENSVPKRHGNDFPSKIPCFVLFFFPWVGVSSMLMAKGYWRITRTSQEFSHSYIQLLCLKRKYSIKFIFICLSWHVPDLTLRLQENRKGGNTLLSSHQSTKKTHMGENFVKKSHKRQEEWKTSSWEGHLKVFLI